MTSTIGVKKIQYPNGTDILTLDSSGTLAIGGNITSNITTTGTVNTPSINGNQIGGRRNIVYNGKMQIAQRGTSETGIGATAGYFTCDRWVYSVAGSHAGRFTMSQSTDTPNGFSHSLKLDCTTADTSIAADELAIIRQHFEGQDLQQIKKGTSDAEQVTVSFYVKASSALTFGLELFDSDNDRQITKLFTTTTSWVRHEITFPADTTGAFNNDNARSLDLSFWIHAGSTYAGGTLNSTAFASTTTANRAAGIDSFFSSTDNEFFLTGVQMELGSQATSFEHRSFGEELALCQRYYQVKSASYHPGNAVGSNKIAAGFTFPVSFRATPSTPPNLSVHRSGNQTVTASIDNVTIGNDKSSAYIRFVGHSVSDETAYNVYLVGNLELDAEL